MRIRIKASRAKAKARKTGQSYWPVAYRWAAMGTLVAYSAVGSKTIPAAHAQDIPGAGPARATADVQGPQSVFHFEIPAGTIDTVVRAFERMTGWTISVAKDGVRTLASPGVSGTLTADQALQKLLADTGLTYRLTSANSA